MKVRACTSFIPLTVHHTSPEKYEELGRELIAASDAVLIRTKSWESCWLAKENPPWKAANKRAEDRYHTDDEHIKANLIQHSTVDVVSHCADVYPDVDVWVYFVYSILKQGDFTGKRITAKHITEFMGRMGTWVPNDIPFPGMDPNRGRMFPEGDNWRFSGSLHVMPTKWLPQITRSYKYECRSFIHRFKAIPTDLAIWPMVEARSGLPYRYYQSEYDYTQLTEFPFKG
jgi:hypothetical protein